MNLLKLLLVDSTSTTDYKLIKSKLKSIPNISFEIDLVVCEKKAQEKLTEDNYDGYVIRETQRNGSGVDLVKYARSIGLQKPLIIMTKKENREKDMIAMNAGADDYIVESKMSVSNIERSLRYSYERYKARLKIAQRELRYKNLFERSVNPIVIVDKDFLINEGNRAFLQLLSISSEEVEGQSIGRFFLDEGRFMEFKKQVKSKGLVKRFEAILYKKEKKKLYCEITTITQFNIQDEVSAYQLIINDLSKIKKQEQRIIRMEKLGLTGRLARSIAHEVRNPLTNINLSIEYLKEEFKGDEGKMVYFDIVERNSNRINELIENLLQSSKPTSLDIKEQSINNLLKEAINLAKDRARLKSIQLLYELGDDIQLSFDFDKLRDALLNVLINAVEAIEDKGKVILKKTINENKDEVEIEITDNGKGITEEALKNMFDPFFTAKEGGMGLGLTSTKNIISQHKGEIDVESELGVGTTFIITLPKA